MFRLKRQHMLWCRTTKINESTAQHGTARHSMATLATWSTPKGQPTEELIGTSCMRFSCVLNDNTSQHGTAQHQCFFFSRYIGYVTPKLMYFHYLKQYFLAQNIQIIFYLILKTEALHSTVRWYTPPRILVGAMMQALRPCFSWKSVICNLTPQPRSSTTLAAFKPWAARSSLTLCPRSLARKQSDSWFTMPAVNSACSIHV